MIEEGGLSKLEWEEMEWWSGGDWMLDTRCWMRAAPEISMNQREGGKLQIPNPKLQRSSESRVEGRESRAGAEGKEAPSRESKVESRGPEQRGRKLQVESRRSRVEGRSRGEGSSKSRVEG